MDMKAGREVGLHLVLMNLRAYIGGIPYDIITKEEWDRKKRRESFYKLHWPSAAQLLGRLAIIRQSA